MKIILIVGVYTTHDIDCFRTLFKTKLLADIVFD